MPTLLTNAAFLAAIQAMSVTGVTKHFDEPPPSLNTADLPAAFPLWPSATFPDMITSVISDGKTRSIGFAICVEASGQGTNAQNYTQYAALMDNLETALNTALYTAANYYTFEMSTRPDFAVGDNIYWTIVAIVRIMTTLGGGL